MTDDEDALVEDLLRIAQQLERDRAEPLAALEALERVQKLCDSERGTRRALAEVAVGFLRAMTRGTGGKQALAVYRFLQNDFEGHHREFLRKTCSATGAWKSEAEPAGVQELLSEGVLFEADGRYLVRRSMRSAVQEAADPVAFRLSSWVERSCLEASVTKDPAAYLAGRIGCTREEANDYLRRHPLKPW